MVCARESQWSTQHPFHHLTRLHISNHCHLKGTCTHNNYPANRGYYYYLPHDAHASNTAQNHLVQCWMSIHPQLMGLMDGPQELSSGTRRIPRSIVVEQWPGNVMESANLIDVNKTFAYSYTEGLGGENKKISRLSARAFTTDVTASTVDWQTAVGPGYEGIDEYRTTLAPTTPNSISPAHPHCIHGIAAHSPWPCSGEGLVAHY